MEFDSNMLVQNLVNYNVLSKKITLWGGVEIVKEFIFQCGGEKLKSPYLQPKLLWLIR
jgi:hypothetical protein